MQHFSRRFLISFIFCFAFIPLTTELNRTGYGYKIDKKNFNNLFYVDDLKLFPKDDYKLEGLLQTVNKFSDNIGQNFGLEKCAKTTFLKGRIENSTSIELDNSTKIKELEEEEVCKDLGVNKSN